MATIIESAVILSRLIVAGIFGLLTFGFGVFFWIGIESHPAQHPIGTAVCGVAFLLSGLAMVAALLSVASRIKGAE
jgi:hypothetical protein